MSEQAIVETLAEWYENFYVCSACENAWSDEWSCMCDDRCPNCNAETVPTSSTDLSRPLRSEDYVGAVQLLRRSADIEAREITSRDAKAYAEAILEGSEHRFSPPRWYKKAE